LVLLSQQLALKQFNVLCHYVIAFCAVTWQLV
jgi:hypothetical protein